MNTEQEAIERLRAAQLEDAFWDLVSHADLRALLDSHERMRAALEFYADKANWGYQRGAVNDYGVDEMPSFPCWEDQGEEAREALEGGKQ